MDITFKSKQHIRYENGVRVSQLNSGALRTIVVKYISDKDNYVVTIYNDDGPHPMWQDNVQMAPKIMKKIVESNADDPLVTKIIFRGINEFSDYAMTIYETSRPIRCILHLIDRHVDIEYY